MEGRARLPIVAIGCMLLVAALAVVLSQTGPRRTGLNRVRAGAQLSTLEGGQTLCQRGERVPGGTGALVASVLAPPEGGGAVRVAVVAGGATIARGVAPGGWNGATLRLPLRPALALEVTARVCLTVAHGGRVGIAGEATTSGGRATIGTRPAHGAVRLVYLRPHDASWWAVAPDVMRRMSVGHPLGGTTIAVFVGLLSAAAAALASWQLARGPR